jgi:hypothetical protein
MVPILLKYLVLSEVTIKLDHRLFLQLDMVGISELQIFNKMFPKVLQNLKQKAEIPII